MFVYRIPRRQVVGGGVADAGARSFVVERFPGGQAASASAGEESATTSSHATGERLSPEGYTVNIKLSMCL